MRDSKDHATLELPGLMPPAPVTIPNLKRAAAGRARKMALQHVQLELLEPANLSGAPAWRLEQNTVLSGTPI